MDVELRFFATVREAVGRPAATRKLGAGATVRDVLAALEREHAGLEGDLLEGGEVARGVTVLHNGTHVTHLDGTETELADGDRISITPPVTGGRE